MCAAESRVVSFAGDQCADKCPENEQAQDNALCVCDDESVTYEKQDLCVKKVACARTVEKNGALVCLEDDVCADGLKLSLDG